MQAIDIFEVVDICSVSYSSSIEDPLGKILPVSIETLVSCWQEDMSWENLAACDPDCNALGSNERKETKPAYGFIPWSQKVVHFS